MKKLQREAFLTPIASGISNMKYTDEEDWIEEHICRSGKKQQKYHAGLKTHRRMK